MYRWDLVEGGYRPKELVNPEYQKGPSKSIMSLMWRMTKPFWGTEKIVNMKNCFMCVEMSD